MPISLVSFFKRVLSENEKRILIQTAGKVPEKRDFPLSGYFAYGLKAHVQCVVLIQHEACRE